MRAGVHGGRRGASTAAATACVVSGAALLAFAFVPGPEPPPVPPREALHHTQPHRQAAKPQLGAALPRSLPARITIPDIGLSTTVEKVSTGANGSIALPNDGDHAGWYTGSPTPGETGNAILVGHVDSRTGPAAFYGLGALRDGDQITIQRRNGHDAVFTVTGMDVYTKKNFPSAHVYRATPGPTLTLITCTGWDDQAHEYESNLVLTARLSST